MLSEVAVKDLNKCNEGRAEASCTEGNNQRAGAADFTL